MSITTNQTPEEYTPGYNPQIFEAVSTMIASTGFTYKAYCTDIATSGTNTYNINKAPVTGEMKFDARLFAHKYLEHYVPNNVYGWQVCTDAIRKITVELREYYGSTEYPGSPPYTTTYYCWNGVLRTLDWVDYNSSNFVYTNTSPHVYLFSGTAESGYKMPRGKTFSDKSLFLYFLGDTTNTFETLRVKTYDSNDTLLGTSDIANSYYNSANYNEKYLCIDVGHKGLSQIDSGDVTGTYPIITSSVAYYILYDVNSSVGSPPAGTEEPIRRVDILCEPTYDIYTVHYLAKSGNFETIHFNKASILSEQVEKTYYRQNPYKLVSNVWSYDKVTPHERVLSSAGQERLVLNSDWITEAEMSIHRELFTSPLIYIDFGSTTGLIPYKLIDTEVQVLKDFNQKAKGLTITLEPTYKNIYQNG